MIHLTPILKALMSNILTLVLVAVLKFDTLNDKIQLTVHVLVFRMLQLPPQYHS